MHSPRRCNHCNHDTHLDIVTVVTIVTHGMAHCARHSPRHGDVDALMCTSQPIHHTRYIGSMFNANNSCMPKLYGLYTLVPATQLTTSSAVLVTSFRPHLFRVFSSSMLVISSWPCTFVPCLAPSCTFVPSSMLDFSSWPCRLSCSMCGLHHSLPQNHLVSHAIYPSIFDDMETAYRETPLARCPK